MALAYRAAVKGLGMLVLEATRLSKETATCKLALLLLTSSVRLTRRPLVVSPGAP